MTSSTSLLEYYILITHTVIYMYMYMHTVPDFIKFTYYDGSYTLIR